MVKLGFQTTEGPLLVLGLSHENLTRLQEGHAIVFALAELKLGPGKLMILYGQTEALILEELEQASGQRLPRIDSQGRVV